MVRKIVLSIAAILMLGCLAAVAQNRQVSGTVTDANGSPIPGATVLVEGTHIGTTTAADGKFVISAPANSTLSFSFIGYETKQVSIGAQTKIAVSLKEDTKAIDDVIVVAFGTTKKEAFTGSATVVKAEDLAKRQTTNVMNALVGNVAGLQMRGTSGQPGTTGSINIRGVGSMYSDIEPLVIVDGAPYSASLSNIPQGDIESVTVLKDAASAALYGARGASGVIIVTTKRGKVKDASINVDMKWGVNSKALQEYKTITDPGQFYEAYYAQLYNKYYYNDGMTAAAADAKANTTMLSDLKYNVYSTPNNENLIINGKLNPNATMGRKVTAGGTDYWLQADDWRDAAFRTSLRQEYNININGATDRSSYYMSMGYLNDEGTIAHSGYERITARVKADYQARKWLKLGANVSYANTSSLSNYGAGASSSASNIFYFTSGMAPIYPIYIRTLDANGNAAIVTDTDGNKVYDYGDGKNASLLRPYGQQNNPLSDSQYNYSGSKGNQLNGTFTVDIKFTDYLKFNSTSTVTWGETKGTAVSNMLYGPGAASGGLISKSSTGNLRTNNIQTLTYFDTFGEHHVNAMLGHEYYNSRGTYLSAAARGMFSNDIKEINATATKYDSSSYSTRYNVEGYFLSAQYDYASKYFASVSYRRDASSMFHPDYRWGNFWSVGGAWLISKENFMRSAKWIDILKLKASIGQQGNDNTQGYSYVDTYSLSKATDTSMAPSFRYPGNKTLTWETTTNFNAGVEFSFWQGRLSGEVNFYNKKTSDLLFWLSVPESYGTRGYYGNLGDIRNYGVEVTLNAGLIRTKTVDWNVTFNLSHNKTKILTLPDSKIDPELGGFAESLDSYSMYFFRKGGEMYNWYGQSYAGVDEFGQALYYINTKDAEGNTIVKGGKTTDFTVATKYENGSIMPKVFGGFGTSLRVANFDLSLTFDYQIGGKVFDYHYMDLVTPTESATKAGGTFSADWVKSWSPNNTSSNMPRWQYGDTYSASNCDRFLTNASYLNFQSFTVGYNFPMKYFRDKLKLRVYVAGENLLFWSARRGLDPRYAYTGNTFTTGYSPVRTISGGVQLSF